MERLGNTRRSREINGNAFRTWGLLFMAAGVIGRGLIQTHMLGVGQASTQQLLETMGASESAMTFATVSLIMQALETCAVPIFALLLINGVEHTSDFKAYFLRIAGLALLTEIPYNLAMGAKFFALDSRNPVFGLVLCLVMLYLFRLYPGSKFKNVLIKVAVTAAAFVWCQMLKIEFGAPMALVVAVMWAYRTRSLYRNIAGATAVVVCTAISPFFLAAPMGFMALHYYNDEESTIDRRMSYLAYPALLLVAWALGVVLC